MIRLRLLTWQNFVYIFLGLMHIWLAIGKDLDHTKIQDADDRIRCMYSTEWPNTHLLLLLFVNRPIVFQTSFPVRQGFPQRSLWCSLVQDYLQAGCAFCRPTNSVKALCPCIVQICLYFSNKLPSLHSGLVPASVCSQLVDRYISICSVITDCDKHCEIVLIE